MLKRKFLPDTGGSAEPGAAHAKPVDASELDLAMRAGRGSRWAADQLIRRYQDRAFAVAYRMSGGDAEQAQDVTQDAFVKALGRIHRFRGQSSFYTWFYRILVNTCLDARKRKRRWSRLFAFAHRQRDKGERTPAIPEEVPDSSPLADPLARLESLRLQQELYRVLESLPDRQRTVFELKIFEEMKLSEIGQVMALETGTVKSHLFRAMKAVRKALGDWA